MTGGLWQDLKRRRVVRVAAAYVAIAFAALEGADLILPRLGLPDRALTVLVVLAVIGFPVALGLSWAFRLTEKGGARAIEAEDGQPVVGTGVRWALLLVATVVFAAGAWWWIPRVPTLRTVDVDPASIMVLPFEVRGGDDVAYLREGLVDLLSTKLDGVGGLAVVDPAATLARVRNFGDVGSPDDALDIATGFGAGRALVGSLVAAGTSVQLRATVHNQTGEDATASVEGELDDLLRLVDGLVSDLVADGLLQEDVSLAELDGLTTESNEALRLYLTGVQNFRNGLGTAETFELLRRAVALDSAFALAAYWAGYVADYYDIDDPVAHYLLAVEHQDRLGLRDRMRLTAALAGGEGRHLDAIRAYSALVERYPDDLAGWFQLGEQIAHAGMYSGRTLAEARDAYERAIEIDPGLAPVYYHLAQIGGAQSDTSSLYAWAANLDSLPVDDLWPWVLRLAGGLLTGDSADVASGFARLRAAESEQSPATIAWSTGELLSAVMGHDAGTVRALVREFSERAVTDTARTVAARWAARIDGGLGRLSEAEAALEGAQRALGPAYLQDRAWVALHPLGASPERISAARSALSSSRAPVGTGEEVARHYLLARLALAAGDGQAAEAEIVALRTWSSDDEGLDGFARDLTLEAESVAAATRGDVGDALESLLQASYWERTSGWLGFPTPTYLDRRLADRTPAFLRAELLAASGRDAEAAMWYEVAADGVWHRAPAWIGLARIRAGEGRMDEARELYARAFGLLENADAEFGPALDLVRAEQTP